MGRMNRNASTLCRLFLLLCLVVVVSAHATQVTDDAGRTVVLARPAKRIVSLAPHATELLFAAGAGDRVVGVSARSDYPPAARALPRVGGYDALNLEAIVGLRPDLVVAWRAGNAESQLHRLRALGLTVYLSEPRTLTQIAIDIERLGRLAGTTAVAKRSADDFRRHVGRLRSRYAGRSPVRVFYEVWNRPLMTINGAHLISRVIGLCGGRNVFAELPVLAGQVSVEAVLAANPDAIVASGTAATRPPWLDDWQRWGDLTAVRAHNLFFVPPDIIQRNTPRILDGAERLCKQLDTARRHLGRQ